MYSSDVFTAFVCQQCGMLAYNTKRGSKDATKQDATREPRFCTYCDTGSHVVSLKMPYACKVTCLGGFLVKVLFGRAFFFLRCCFYISLNLTLNSSLQSC